MKNYFIDNIDLYIIPNVNSGGRKKVEVVVEVEIETKEVVEEEKEVNVEVREEVNVEVL